MKRIRIGVQLEPQHTTYADFANAVREVEALDVDSLWTWDHFYPPWEDEIPPVERPGSSYGYHFEAWTLLTAMAMLTQRVEIGHLVTCNSYRNPALLSNMAKTVDHICNGRLILGIGAGWRKKEYTEFGYSFGTAEDRLGSLESALPIIKRHWATDIPRPVRPSIPILIGGDGEKFTLRIVAQYGDMWNSLASPRTFKHKNDVLNHWCERVGRDPSAIERTVVINQHFDRQQCDEYVNLGAQHLIINVGAPWDLSMVEQLARWQQSINET